MVVPNFRQLSPVPGGMDPSGLESYSGCVERCIASQVKAGTAVVAAGKACHTKCKHLRTIWNGVIDINRDAGVPTHILEYNEAMGTQVFPTTGGAGYFPPEVLYPLGRMRFPNGYITAGELECTKAERVCRNGFNPATDRWPSGFSDFYNEGFHRYFDDLSGSNLSGPSCIGALVRQIDLENQWPESHRMDMGEEAVSETLAVLVSKIALDGCVPKYEQLNSGELAPLHDESGQAFGGMPAAQRPMSKDLCYDAVRLLYGPYVEIPWCK